MATRDTYTKVHEDWKGRPDKTTPVMPEDLEHIEQGIKDAMDNRALKGIYGDSAMSLGRKSGYMTGYNSITAGYEVIAMGEGSYAGGNETKAYANYSHAEGEGTIAGSISQHVDGRYNIQDGSDNYVHITGGGTSDNDRKNIYTLDWLGNAIFAGNVQGTCNGKTMSLYGIQMEMEGRYNGLSQGLDSMGSALSLLSSRVDGMSATKVFDTKADLDAWLAVEGNPETLIIGQNIYITATGTPDYWWDGTGLQVLETDTVVIESMTYEETTTALNSQEMGEINKIPNVYAIRDWCKSMMSAE